MLAHDCSKRNLYDFQILFSSINYFAPTGRSVCFFEALGIELDRIQIDQGLFRPNEITDIYGSNEKARDQLGWRYERSLHEVMNLILGEAQMANILDKMILDMAGNETDW